MIQFLKVQLKIYDNDLGALNLETLVTDQEEALVNTIKKFFPNSKRISCLFHYKQDILRNLKSQGLYKKNSIKVSDIILEALGKIPFIYKGDIKKFDLECGNLIKVYPTYDNFINNYLKF